MGLAGVRDFVMKDERLRYSANVFFFFNGYRGRPQTILIFPAFVPNLSLRGEKNKEKNTPDS